MVSKLRIIWKQGAILVGSGPDADGGPYRADKARDQGRAPRNAARGIRAPKLGQDLPESEGGSPGTGDRGLLLRPDGEGAAGGVYEVFGGDG